MKVRAVHIILDWSFFLLGIVLGSSFLAIHLGPLAVIFGDLEG